MFKLAKGARYWGKVEVGKMKVLEYKKLLDK